jgi:hypothetical protein
MGEIKLRFKLDPERLTLDQLIGMQDGEYKAMRDVLALSLIDERGEFLKDDEAKKTIGGLKLSQVLEAASEFVRQVRDAAVNPTNGEPSLPQ